MLKVTKEDLGAEVQLYDFLSDSTTEETDEYITKKIDEIEKPLKLDESFDSTVLLMGLPIVSPEKYDKFCKAVRTIITQILKSKKVEFTDNFSLDILTGDNGETLGFCLLTFESSYQAETACSILYKAPFDKQNILTAVIYDTADIMNNDNEEESLNNIMKSHPMPTIFNKDDLRDWLIDDRCKEQYVIRYQNNTEIYIYDQLDRSPKLLYNGERAKGGKRVWTDFCVEWSPMGSYLVTFHRQGVALWGGNDWNKKVRFEHNDVKYISFSPDENYLLTWDGTTSIVRSDKSIKIWSVNSGRLKRSFPTPLNSNFTDQDIPNLFWSPSSKYLAFCTDKNELFIYETDTMSLIENPLTGTRTCLKYSLLFFNWSPVDDIISIWCPEHGDTPGRLTLLSLTDIKEIAVKNVFNIREANVYWQSKGEYLALQTLVSRRTGKKAKKEYVQLEIFRVKEKNIPVDTIHIEGVVIKAFEWEPSNRFLIVVLDEITRSQYLRFYQVGATQIDCILNFNFSTNVETVKWSPFGTNFVLNGSSGNLTFCQLTSDNKFEIFQKEEHFMCNNIQWDPTGRYVTSAFQSKISEGAYKYSTETGFVIWSFQGRRLYSSPLEIFYQFSWRPHPPSLLNKKTRDEIYKKLKEYSKKFDKEDEEIKYKRKSTIINKRNQIDNEFNSILNSINEWYNQQPEYSIWIKAKENLVNSFNWEETEEIIEIDLDVSQEIIG